MTKMKKLIVCLALLVPASVFGWGATGHRVVGLIADKHLSAKAKKALSKVLGQNSLSEVSNWMDEVRSDSTYNHMSDWHWVTIEAGKTYDQSPKNPKGDVIATLERIVGELKKHTLDSKTEQEYIKMLVHLVGDIHQPLHVGCCDDQGGNKVKVKWFRNDSNLHSVWDSSMIDDTKLSYTELASYVDEPDAITLAKWQKNTVREWADESMDPKMRKSVYDIGDGNLSYKYSYKYFSIVKQRLGQAGIRLAAILNEIYAK
ncbi:endonuclease [Cytophagales bacterium WSM2-2]|nr:endonuclease [Cytophagales bacterium WSM2-2]